MSRFVPARRSCPPAGIGLACPSPHSTNEIYDTGEIDLRPQCKALGGRLFCLAEGADIKVMNCVTGRQLHAFKGHTGPVTCLVLDSGEGVIFSGSTDCTVRKWDLMRFEEIATMRGHSMMVTCLATHEREEALLSGSADGTIVKWNIATSSPMATFRGHTMIVTSMAVFQEEGALFTGSGDKTVRKWNLETGECLMKLVGHSQPITCVTVDPSEGTVYTGELGGHTVRQFNAKTGTLLKTESGPVPEVTYVIY